MKKMKIKIFIGGAVPLGSNGAIVSTFIDSPYFPSGDDNENGSSLSEFYSFDSAATYICDLLDILRHFELSTDLLESKVYLNIKTLCKSYKGESIVKLLDKLEKMEGYIKLRSFPTI